MTPDDVTHEIIGSAMAVHSAVGPGLLEKVDDPCIRHEFGQRQLQFTRQVRLPVCYKGLRIEAGLRVDYIVENCVILELKAVEKLHPLHSAQLLSYLKLSGISLGLIINFNVVHLRDGIHRIVNKYNPDATNELH